MSRLGERYCLPRSPDEEGTPLTGPVLIITGKQDHVVGYEDQLSLLRRYPHSTYAVLHGAGHNCYVDQPVVTGALLHQWAHDLPR